MNSEPNIDKSKANKTQEGNHSALHTGHRQKLRNRFLKEGLENFEDHNVLELLLFSVIPRKDTNPIAHKLIDRFGSLYRVLEAPYEELIKVEGVGEQAAAFITMIPAVSQRYLTQRREAEGIIGREEIKEYVRDLFIGEDVEKIRLVLIDNRFRVIAVETISEGIVNFTTVDTRKIIEYSLKHNAPLAIVAHNHPRGFAIPSRADISSTARIRDILSVINVRLIDHIIVAPDGIVSLADSQDFLYLFSASM